MDNGNSLWATLQDSTQNHGGWIVAALTATWGVVLRTLVGRYERNQKLEADAKVKLEQTLQDINLRLTRIEGRFIERDRRLEDSDVR